MLELFGDVQTFIQRNNDFATVTHSKLLTFFKKALLKAELAVVVDFGVHHRHLSAAANERKRESYLNQACGEDLVLVSQTINFAGRQAWQRL